MNICAYDLDSFQTDFENLIQPVWEDSLSVTDKEGNDVSVTDDIKKTYLHRVIDLLGSKYSFSNKTQVNNAIQSILDTQEDYLDNNLKLSENEVRAALYSHTIKEETALTEDYTTAHLEKEDSITARRNTFTTMYLTKYFGKCKAAQNYCKRKSIQTIIDSCILAPDVDSAGNVTSKHIVQNDNDLNDNIRNQQEILYKNILKYLRFNLKDTTRVDQLPQTMYSQDGQYLRSFEKLNELFGNTLNENTFNSNTLNDLFINYNDSTGIGKSEYQKIIDGYVSWVMLKNFDTILRSNLGASIFIDETLPQFASKDPQGRINKIKYSLTRAKASNMNQTWRTSEDIDINKEISNIVQLLVTNIKYQGSDRNIKFNEFGYIISKIKGLSLILNPDNTIGEGTNFIINNILPNGDTLELSERTASVVNGKTLTEVIDSIKESPQDYLPAIFEILSNNQAYDRIFISNSKLFSEFDRTLIKSLYDGLFNVNSPTSLLYANDQNGYSSQNYLSYLTEAADAIYDNKYLQYFRDIDGNIYIRNMYDQTINNIERNIENGILAVNTKQFGTFDSFIQDRNLSITLKDENNPNSIDRLEFKLTTDTADNRYIVVYNRDSVPSVVDKTTNKAVHITKEDILPLADELLQQGFQNNQEYWNTFVINSGGNEDTAVGDLTNLVGHVILNKYISNKLLNDNQGNSIRDVSVIRDTLNNIYGVGNKRIPKFNKQFGEIYLTNNVLHTILYRMATAKASVEGRLTASQLKDGSGNSVPTTTLSRLLGSFRQQWQLQGRLNTSAVKDFQLLKNGILKGIYQAKEYKDNFNSTSTAHTQFNPAEVEHAEIVYDFIQGIAPKKNDSSPIGDGVVAFLPSVNSDKSTISRIAVDLHKVKFTGTLNGTQYTEHPLYTLIIDNNGNPTLYADEVINQLLCSELGKYYNNINQAITSQWNKVGQAFKEYFANDPTNPYANVNINYAIDKFDNLNKIYLKNPEAGKLTDIINNVVRAWNNNHTNDIITLTEHSTYEVDRATGFLIPNINLLALTSRFNNPDLTQEFFNTQNKDLLVNLLNDGFNVQGLPIATLNLNGYIIQINNINDIYAHIKQINPYFSFNTPIRSIIKHLGNNIKLNPLINLYNKLSYLFTQEWMTSTVGGHFNHPSKVKGLDMNVFRTVQLTDEEANRLDIGTRTSLRNTIKLAQLLRDCNYDTNLFKERALHTTKYKSTQTYKTSSIEIFLDKLQNTLELDEAGRFNSQNKRNVSFTAAMHPFQLNSLQGIPSICNICVIKDNNARIHTVTGVDTEVPTSDGATYINPWMTYWENGSLGAAKVGINKKQFIHFYDETTGTGGIVKTAGFAMTNELMKNSIFQRQMTKMMTDRSWVDQKGNKIDLSTIDLTKDFNNNPISLTSTTSTDGNFFIQKEDGTFWKFVQLQRNEDGTYNRLVQQIDPNNLTNVGEVITDLSNQVIDSNYKLWQILGGYNCFEQKHWMDRLTHSEYSIQAVADMGNKIGIRLHEGSVKTQKDVYQYMKHSDLHYMPTEGAVKQGAANAENINSYLKGKDLADFKPNFMHIHMNQSGIQLDKEHHADQEDLSIFTQVISACAARGYTQKQAQRLYSTLASLANSAVYKYLNFFSKYLESPQLNKDSFQQVISDLIAKALLNQTNTSDVLNYVASNLMQLAKEGKQIKFKDNIPFSDSAIYNKLISIIGTTLTRAAIKIKMPGLLAVLCPSYDVIKLYNERMLSSYKPGELQELQLQFDNNPLWQNGDFVGDNDIELTKTYKIFINTDVDQTLVNTALSTLGENIKLENGQLNYLIEVPAQRSQLKQFLKRNSNLIDKVSENVEVGRNLAPYNVYFEGVDQDGITRRYSLYDCDIVKQKFLPDNTVTDSELQTVLNAVSPTNSNNTVQIDGKIITINKDSINIKPYEIVMPKVFASNFGLTNDSDLNVISNDKDYFSKQLLNSVTSTIGDKYYNLAFTKLNGDPIYVLNRNEAQQSDNFYPIDVPTDVDEDGNVNIIDSSYDITYTLSKNQTDIDNNPTLKQDEIWQYVDNNGIAHKVIVTDDLQYWADNTTCNGLQIGLRENLDNIKDILSNVKKGPVKIWYDAIRNFTRDKSFKNNVYAFKQLMNNIDGYYTTIDSVSRKLSIINFIQEQGNAIWTSFMKSLDLVAARIPAQSMQSFMAMKIVGFVDSDVNTAYVSTLQTYLQGSDYDVDAVSLSMYAFSPTGKFIGWSDKFDLSSPEMLSASLSLPFPTGKYFNVSDIHSTDNSINLSDHISTIDNLDGTLPFTERMINGVPHIVPQVNTAKGLRAFGELIEQINNNGFNVRGERGQLKELLAIVNDYNSYISKIRNRKERENAIKNYIENSIYDIIINPINQEQAQSSVDATTSPWKKLANESSNSNEASKNNPGAFTTNIHAINNNAVGKMGIGISAVGLKSYFALTQYFNNILSHGTPKEKARLRFNVSVLGQNYNYLTNIYSDNTSDDVNAILNAAKNDTDYALQLSAILSLSTDNAKELALAKLNCDANTMGMWLYGLTIGVPFRSINSIMTSRTGFKLSEMLHGNVFNDMNNMSMNRLFNFIDHGPQLSDGIDWQIIKRNINTPLNNPKQLETYLKSLLQNPEDGIRQLYNLQQVILKINNSVNTEKDKYKAYNTIGRIIDWIRVRQLTDSETAIVNGEVTGYNVYQEFKKLYEGANELKSLGQILHLNQGLYTSDFDTLNLLNRIQNIIADRLYAKNPKYKTENSDIFNLHKFLNDKNYRETRIQLYESKAKTAFNLLDTLANVPNYLEYLKILDLQHNMYYAISTKYRTVYNLGQTMVQRLNAHSAEDKEKILKRTQQYVDNYIANKWLLETNYFDDQGINIMLPTGATYFETVSNNEIISKQIKIGGNFPMDVFGNPRTVSKLTPGILVNLGTDNGRASFKNWMETIVIPNLKKGNNGLRNAHGKYISQPGSPLVTNKFIQSLSPTVFTNTPMKTTITGYSLGINMSPRTDIESEIFEMHKNEFNKLKDYGEYGKYHVGSQTYNLTDLFFLYNLCTYQNRLGENTLTRIFEDSRDDGLIRDYYNYVNTMDRNSDIILYQGGDNSDMSISNADSLDITDPNFVAQIAPTGNPYTTTLNQFLRVNPVTGEVELSTKNKYGGRFIEEVGEYVSPWDYETILSSNYYPSHDLQERTVTINSNNQLITPENRTFERPIYQNGQLVGTEEVPLNSIEIHHRTGSMVQIYVNGELLNIPPKYKDYFKHIPTRIHIDSKGNPQQVFDFPKLIDDIVTLISKEC